MLNVEAMLLDAHECIINMLSRWIKALHYKIPLFKFINAFAQKSDLTV